MKLSIGENIRKFRKQRGLMQEKLAEALGVTIGAVSKWERGSAVPDLNYIVEMADIFGVSVDVLLGYQVQSGAAQDMEERIHNFQRDKDFESAAMEAEKALIRYPNDFRIVYRCGEMYQLKGIETGDPQDLERAIELLGRSVPLLSQNTDSEINEFSIYSEVAQCYLALGKKDAGLELLKKYNVGGIHNDLIGLTYSTSDNGKPEEAAPFLMKAFGSCLMTLVRTMTGYANYYAQRKDYESALEAMLWLLRYLESIKTDEESVSYVDKIRAPYYSECAHLADIMGRKGEVESYLRQALRIAKAFDASPVYNIYGIKFCIGETKHATAYDDMGKTAIDAIENQMLEEPWSKELRTLWEELKNEQESE